MKNTLTISLSLLLAPLLSLHVADAADLVLLSEGKSDYQIVVPDGGETELLTECLNQTARLVQTAFAVPTRAQFGRRLFVVSPRAG